MSQLKDIKGRVWNVDQEKSLVGWVSCPEVNNNQPLSAELVEQLCGPLEPYEPLARVYLGVDSEGDMGFVRESPYFRGALDVAYTRTGSLRTTLPKWPLSKARTIAEHFRALGYTHAATELVND